MLEKGEGDDEFVYYPVEMIDIEQVPLSELNYRFPNDQIEVAHFDFSEEERVVSFKNGAYNRTYITYDSAGKKKSLRNFKNDEQIGEVKEF